MATWISTEGTAPDPLANFARKPIISEGGPGMSYLGRIIIELWDVPGMTNGDDSRSMAIAAEATDGDHAALTSRVAAALPKLVSRSQPFKP